MKTEFPILEGHNCSDVAEVELSLRIQDLAEMRVPRPRKMLGLTRRDMLENHM